MLSTVLSTVLSSGCPRLGDLKLLSKRIVIVENPFTISTNRMVTNFFDSFERTYFVLIAVICYYGCTLHSLIAAIPLYPSLCTSSCALDSALDCALDSVLSTLCSQLCSRLCALDCTLDCALECALDSVLLTVLSTLCSRLCSRMCSRMCSRLCSCLIHCTGTLGQCGRCLGTGRSLGTGRCQGTTILSDLWSESESEYEKSLS